MSIAVAFFRGLCCTIATEEQALMSYSYTYEFKQFYLLIQSELDGLLLWKKKLTCTSGQILRIRASV